MCLDMPGDIAFLLGNHILIDTKVCLPLVKGEAKCQFDLRTPFIRCHIEAGTLLEPFLRLHGPVPVAVRTEVTMTAHTGDGEILFQGADEGTHGKLLLLGTGVRRMSLFVQAALVGDTDALLIEAAGMGAGLVQRTGAPDEAILADVEMIADAAHALQAMATEQVLLGKVDVRTGGGTMHHYHTDGASYLFMFHFVCVLMITVQRYDARSGHCLPLPGNALECREM